MRVWGFSKTSVAATLDKQLLVKRTKEPEIDVFDEQEELIVLADLPGVSEEDIRVSVEKDLLLIEATSAGPAGQVQYYGEVILPCEVHKSFQRACKGGILEVHLRPMRRPGKTARAKKGRGRSAVSARRPAKKKKGRRRKDDASEKKQKRKGGTRRGDGPKRKA